MINNRDWPKWTIKLIDDIGIQSEPTILTATSKRSAWGKFTTLYFGSLKPNPDDYTVERTV